MRSAPLLPPLHVLRAFEAVARLGGVSRAGRDLSITQSAVSHHIRNLESALGVELFRRHARGMTLTLEGERYFEVVTRAFAMIAEGTAALKGAAVERVKVSVLPSFAAHWLAPRLSRFHTRHPTILVELEPSLDPADFRGGDLDFAIRYGDGDWAGLETSLLMTERLTPVVAGGRVGAAALLMTRKAFDWALWAKAARFDLTGRRQVQLTDYNVVLQSALKGEGMALGRLRLIGDQVASGALATPFDMVVESPDAAYWLVMPSGRQRSAATEAFLGWLKAEADAC